MIEGYWRTAQAAAELGIPPRHMRKLCEANLVEAERTEGGQWRIPMAEVDRLKKAGVPPAPLTGEPETRAKAADPKQNGSTVLLAPPSSAAVGAAEEVLISQSELQVRRNKVERLKLAREATQVGDFFRDRKRQEAEEEAARVRHERERREERERQVQQLQAEQARQEWRDGWIDWAQRLKPWGAPDTIELEITAQVEAVLDTLGPCRDELVVRRLVKAAAERALEPWRKDKEKQEAIERAIDRLDYEMKYGPSWKARAHEAAAAGIDRLRPGATASEMEAAGSAALAPLILEYRQANKCAQFVSEVWLKLTNANSEERQDAEDSVRAALDAQPVGASDRQLEQARDTALQLIKDRIAQRIVRERAEAAELQDRKLRETQMDRLNFMLPYGISDKLKEKAREELSELMDELPQGTPERQLDKLREQTGERYKRVHELRQQKNSLVEDGLGEIYPYLQRLEKEWEFDKSVWTIAQEIREPIREALQEELTGKETREHVLGIVRRMVKELT